MVRSQFSLHYSWSSDRTDIQYAVAEELRAVQQVQGLACVFMFHGDGRVREQALHHLEGPLSTMANVYALCWRLNDWAPQVRLASLSALNRVLPSTPASIIAPALKAILPHVHSWGRWSADGPKQIDAILFRPDVASMFLEEILSTRQSNLGSIFRELSKSPWIDPHIERAFKTAPLPHVRAMALEMLLSGKSRWPIGKLQRVWIDRSMGKYRTDPVFSEREITVEVDAIALISSGATDRSAMVRKRAADGIIALRHNPDMIDELAQLAKSLKNDPNIGVRSRIDFFYEKNYSRAANQRLDQCSMGKI